MFKNFAHRIQKMVVDNDSRQGRIFDFIIQAMIVLSLLSFAVETLPDLSENTRQFLHIFECCTIGMFTFEYIIHVWTYKKKLKFIFSFTGIIDLMSFLPFYLIHGLDFRSIRIFQLCRLFRIFKLFKYSKAIQRFHRALVIAKEELVLFGFVSILLLYLTSVGIYFFEHHAQPEAFASVFHSMWWAVATLTTVGYGDIYPITVGGKIFTFVILIIGLGVIAVPTGIISSALSQARKEIKKEEK